jgi:Family of unknown function (DUF5681)
MKNPRSDYHVGYGRAPVHARFKPGQSGNPRGRPKGKRKVGEVLDRHSMKGAEDEKSRK